MERERFTAIPLTSRSVFDFAGTVMTNALELCRLGNEHVLVAGSLQGDVSIFSLSDALPIFSVSGLGSVSLIRCAPLAGFPDPVLYVFTIEGQMHVLNPRLEDQPHEMYPIFTVQVAGNISSCVIADVDADGRDEVMVGTTDGVVACWRYEQGRDEPFSRVKYWHLQNEITALSLVREDTQAYIYIGYSDGLFVSMPVSGNENPERLSPKNVISEKLGESGTYLLLSKPHNGYLLAVNGFGKFLYLSDVGKSPKLSANTLLSLSISKIPVFADLIPDDPRPPVGVIGCSDGSIFFVNQHVSNYNRYEEVVTAYKVGYFTAPGGKLLPSVVVAGRSKKLVVFYDLNFLNNTLPNFISAAKSELEELRKILNDLQTSSAELIETYLYMPLPEA